MLGFSDFAIIAWIVVVFAGAAAYTTRHSADLRRLERKLDALLRHQGIALPLPPILPGDISEEVQRLARDPARRIEAIKLHREQTGLGLADAKHEVEEYLKTVG